MREDDQGEQLRREGDGDGVHGFTTFSHLGQISSLPPHPTASILTMILSTLSAVIFWVLPHLQQVRVNVFMAYFSFRGLPPFRPFSRELVAFRSDFTRPIAAAADLMGDIS